MTIRNYECEKCGASKAKEIPIALPSPVVLCCGKPMLNAYRIQTKPNTGILDYIETNLPGGPVRITSPSQRDALYRKYDVTEDKYSDLDRRRRRTREAAAIDSVTLDQVMTKHKKDRGEWL